MKHFWLSLTLCLGLSATSVRAESNDVLDNWHQWRGPHATGMAPRGNPPIEWSEQKNIKWKVPIPGRGGATPIIWGDQVFVLTAVDTGRKVDASKLPKQDPNFEKKTQAPTTLHQFLVLSIDRQTGKVRWQRTATEQVPHEGHHPSHSYAAGSPTTDGRYLYVPFGSRGLYCYDLEGNLKWQREFGLMQTRLGWGEGLSPTLHRDKLVVNWDHEGPSFVAVLDARTGRTLWKADRDEKSSWATPLVVEHQGRTQAIVSATNLVRSYDLATGEILWQCGGQTVNVIPSPMTNGQVAFCMSGYRGAAAYAIPLDARGDLTGSDKVIWKYERGTPYVPSALLAGDRLFFTQANTGVLTSLDTRTGKPILDRVRVPGLTSLYASPVGAAGRIYFVDRDGTCVVLKQSDELEVLATNRLDDSIDASPAVVGRQLFLRGDKQLYCIEAD